MRSLMVVVLLIAVSSLVVADGISMGTYMLDGGYASGYIAGNIDRFSFYIEREQSLSYDLDVLRYQFCDDAALVYRHDSPNWNRLGFDIMTGGGDTKGMIRVLLGTGDAETWVDYFGPSIDTPIKNLGIESHLRWSPDGQDRFWIGPGYRNDRYHAYFHPDLLGEQWAAGVDLMVFEW